MAQIPQITKSGKRNPYYVTCPKCHAEQGQYCQGKGTNVSGVGFVPHPERVRAADRAPLAE